MSFTPTWIDRFPREYVLSRCMVRFTDILKYFLEYIRMNQYLMIDSECYSSKNEKNHSESMVRPPGAGDRKRAVGAGLAMRRFGVATLARGWSGGDRWHAGRWGGGAAGRAGT